MSILGQKLQSITESYNNYVDPAYECYNADCGGGILLQAEAYDDMNDIMESCYNMDCKEIVHLNKIMTLKESGASDYEIAREKENYEYVHEAETKESGEGFVAKLKAAWNKFVNFIFSIGRKIKSWFQDTKKTYDQYKDRIKGKSVTLKGYNYDLNLGQNTGFVEDFDKLDIEPKDLDVFDKEGIYAELRGCEKGKCEKKDITLSGDTIADKINEVLSKDKVKETMDPIIKKVNADIDELSKKAKEAKGDELADINKKVEIKNKLISKLNLLASEYNKAAKEANSFYKKAILMMVSGKTGKQTEDTTKKQESEQQDQAEGDNTETKQESYFDWDWD